MDGPIARRRTAHPRLTQLTATLDRLLRRAGDPRLAVVLILAAGGWNIMSALRADAAILEHPGYLALVAAILLAGLASVAVRLPVAWREWRNPGPIGGREARSASLELSTGLDAGGWQRLVRAASAAGYRVSEPLAAGRWGVAGTKRGWSRFAGLGSHAALVALIVAAAASGATSRESVFSLLPGEQALLDVPRAGFTDAVRLERLEAEFGADRRPSRLDTTVTFLRDGTPASTETITVNRPGSFGGYLVHGWTYGPAARLRVTTLAGRPLLDAGLPLDEERDGVPVGGVELPPVGAGIGLALVDAESNEVTVSLVGSDGATHSARLRPGGEQRVGPVIVRLERLDAYVTFLSRRDPMLPVVIGSSALLVASLAVGFWLPRRRILIREERGRLLVLLRGERFDDPTAELAAILPRLRASLP